MLCHWSRKNIALMVYNGSQRIQGPCGGLAILLAIYIKAV